MLLLLSIWGWWKQREALRTFFGKRLVLSSNNRFGLCFGEWACVYVCLYLCVCMFPKAASFLCLSQIGPNYWTILRDCRQHAIKYGLDGDPQKGPIKTNEDWLSLITGVLDQCYKGLAERGLGEVCSGAIVLA